MLFKIAIVCCLLTVFSAKEVSTSLGFLSGRIVGGEDSEKGEFPHQISFQTEYFGSTEHQCGGSILNKTWILTAAHCLVDLHPVRKLYIKAGRIFLKGKENSEQISRVIKRIVHEEYPSVPVVAPYDIALLKLETPLVFNKFVQPINLPEKNEKFEGQVTISGWGTTDPLGYDPSNRLQKLNVPIENNKDCEKQVEALTGRHIPIVSSYVCTGPLYNGGISTCAGDSGGPLVKYINEKPKQIGIVSWGLSPCGKESALTIYTRVAFFIDWIKKKIAENED